MVMFHNPPIVFVLGCKFRSRIKGDVLDEGGCFDARVRFAGGDLLVGAGGCVDAQVRFAGGDLLVETIFLWN